MTTTMLPCPFCGSNDIDPEGWGTTGGISGPCCNVCMASVGSALKPTEENIAAWNVRHPWRTMDSAPLDGKHCILAVPEPGGFVYSVQGAYQNGQWNAVHRDNVKPLYWMPNFRLPAGWLDATVI